MLTSPPRTPSPTAERTAGGGRTERFPAPEQRGRAGGSGGGGPERRMPERPPQGHRAAGNGNKNRGAKQRRGRGGEGRAALTCGGAVRNEGGGLLLAGSFCRTARYI